MTKKDIVVSNLNNIFSEDKDIENSHVGKRLRETIKSSERIPKPKFPKQIQVETTNICNHGCEFCAYTLMERPKRHIDRILFERIVRESYELGAREIGLFAGAEPMACKWLDEYIILCRDIGYEYMYISTNGALGNETKFKKVIDAGLSSIKFSVNGGNRETYKRVHGRDDFNKVISNIKYVNQYRKDNNIDLWVGVSFVGMVDTNHSFDSLKSVIEKDVDEIIYYEASNQSGQMPQFPDPPYIDCHLPFNKAHFSLEGYIKVCCNDYENLLAVENIADMSIAEAWHSERFQKLRQQHIDNNLECTLCDNCIRAAKTPAFALNEELAYSRKKS